MPSATGDSDADNTRHLVCLEHFGAPADYKHLFQEFGITADAASAAAKESLAGVTN